MDPAALRDRLAGGFVTSVEVVDQIGSTNAELARAAAAGAPEGTVLVAEWQHAGRGRFDRAWTSPPRAGLTFSTVVRPAAVPVARWSWLPLLAGVALQSAIRDLVPQAGPAAVRLKWPNDLLLGPGQAKAAGILAEVHRDSIVLGMGVNVHHTASELPGPQATSLDLAFPEAGVDRSDLLVAIMSAFAVRYGRWTSVSGHPVLSGLRAEYEDACDTIGRAVEVDQRGTVTAGRASGVDDGGGLLVVVAEGVRSVSAADVTHVRPVRR